ncbi:MAG: TIGR02281 family clan AA aspartic protease [Rhizobiales bacterium]|nr:TIGR02281 family clan AA aspartic protease [Hyphomicrobiales bacterium]
MSRLGTLALIALAMAGGGALFFVARDNAWFHLNESDLPRLVLFAGILVFVAAGLAGRALRPGEVLRGLLAWGVVIVVLVGLYANRDQLAGVAGRLLGAIVPGVPVSGTLAGTGDDSVVITRGLDGHFAVLGAAGAKPVMFLVDTGASFVTLSPEDARGAGIDLAGLRYDLPIRTANGTMVAAPVSIGEVSVGGIVRRNVRGLVAPAGALDQSLLGMSFLDTLSSYSVAGDRLILKP